MKGNKVQGAEGCSQPKPHADYGCDQYHKECSEPLCCGFDCQGPDICDSGVFPKGQTKYTSAKGDMQGCSFISSTNAGGVMCCSKFMNFFNALFYLFILLTSAYLLKAFGCVEGWKISPYYPKFW